MKGIIRRLIYFTVIILVIIVYVKSNETLAEATLADSISTRYLNTVKKYLYLGDKGTNSFDFDIKKERLEDGATYTWYVKGDKGNPDSVTIDKKTGVVTAKKAGTAYIRCKITLKDGKILRPEASVTVRNNITEVAISNIPEDLSIEAGIKIDFNRKILNTVAGKGKKSQGITRWEVSGDTSGVGMVSVKGEVLPIKEGEFTIRAVCFQSKEKYELWLNDKKANDKFITASSSWVTIQVTAPLGIVTVATQDQLEKLLLSDDIKQLAITTEEETDFLIPYGDYSDKTLIVNAANADVENHGLFKNIIINAIKDNTWIELTDGNIIHLNDDVVSIVVGKDVKVKKIVINQPNSLIRLEINGMVERIIVLQPSAIFIVGNNETVAMTVEDSAEGSSIQTSVPLKMVIKADTIIELNKGAENSVLDKSASSVEIKVNNNTDTTIVITTENSNMETVASGNSTVSNEASKPVAQPTLIRVQSIGNIVGIPKVGVELSVGEITPVNATVTYQWMIATEEEGVYTNILGANSDKYTPIASDSGKYIKVTATARGSYTGSISSIATSVILKSDEMLQAEAEAAINAYESASLATLLDVIETENLKLAASIAIEAVGDVSVKAVMEQRMRDRATYIAETRRILEAEEAVTAYERTPLTTLSEVSMTEVLKAVANATVAVITDSTAKVALVQRIAVRETQIAEVKVQMEADEVVAVYETAPLGSLSEVAMVESLKSAADTAVEKITDITVKIRMEQRIVDRAMQIAMVRAELEAEEAIIAYETAPLSSLPEITIAESLKVLADTAVAAVADETVKSAMEQRIADRTAQIAETRAEMEAELAVITYETVPLSTLSEVIIAESLKGIADTAVALISNNSVKVIFEQRIVVRANQIAEERSVLEAEAAVTKAENTKTQADLDTAQVLVTALSDSSIKSSLQYRLNLVQKYIDADLSVKKAETSTLQFDLDAAQILVSALPDGTIKSALQTRLNVVQIIINDWITAAENAIAVNAAKVKIENTVYLLNQSEISTEADVKAAIETVISGLDLDGVSYIVTKVLYTPAMAGTEAAPSGTNGSYTFTTSLEKGSGTTLASGMTNNLIMNIVATLYIPPETITSKAITNFNFATINSSTATLISKPMTTSDFSGSNKKLFTITDGAGNVITVDLWWNITSDQGFSVAALVGSAVESYIQQYFFDKGGVEALMNRTLWAASFSGNTFTLSTFYEGLLNSITIGGPDASYFFGTLYAQGTDLDTSANKNFSISDGIHTANINLNSNLNNMDGLVNRINNYLNASSVQAFAVKINENSFKIVGDNIVISGVDKSIFFSSFYSE